MIKLVKVENLHSQCKFFIVQTHIRRKIFSSSQQQSRSTGNIFCSLTTTSIKKKRKLIFGPRRSSHTHKDRCWISVYALKTSRKNFLITVQTPAEYFDHEKECHQIHKQGSTTLKQFACLKECKRCAPIKRKNICASHSNNNNKRGDKEGGERKESIASPEKKHNNLMIQRVN